MMKGSDISETSRFISALNIFLSCVVALCLSPKFQTMPVSGLVSQGGQNIGLEASCQYGQIFETGVHFSFDVLPSRADQGSCAHKCIC